MKNTARIFILAFLSVALMLSTGYPQKKLAQTGFQFLSVGQNARAVAMGEAFSTIEGVSTALFYNPAGIARMKSMVDVSVNYFNWIADIRHTSMSLAFSPENGQYGVFGVSVQSVDYGDIEGTMVWENEAGYVDTEVFSPQAFAIGFGYGRSLTDRFVVGGQVKYVAQSLGRSVIPGGITKDNVANSFAFDFGTIYKTGFESLAFGMSVRNFSQEIKFEEEGFQLPLTFKIGASFDALEYFMPEQNDHSLLVIFDAVHPRSYPEYINFGTEYKFMNTAALRLGYISNQDEYGFTTGFGLDKFGFSLDYAYTPFGVFERVHRFSASFRY